MQEIERICAAKVPEETRIQQALRVIVRPGADWWARYVVKLVSCEQQELGPEEKSWPVGRKRAEYEHVPVAPRNGSGAAPQISIFIPVYEVAQETWLRECIESILQQDRGEDWAEIIVVDDGSKSQLGKTIAQDYESRVRYHYNSPNLGLLPNHNHCLDLARGDFVHFVHQDDLVELGFYDAVLDPMLSRDDIVASFSSWKHVDIMGISPLNGG